MASLTQNHAGAAAATSVSATTGSSARSLPNILITGTPGTGKTATAALCASTIMGGGVLTHVDCSKLVVEKRSRIS